MSRPARRAHVVGLLLCLVGALGACTSEDAADGPGSSPRTEAPTSTSVTLAASPARVTAKFHRIHGRLPDARRKAVRSEVTAVVEQWWQAAYLGGTYPRTGFRGAFPGFTRGARARALQDVRLMTNRDIGERVDSVTLRRGSVVLEVLAVGGRAAGVTARFLLSFTTTGERAGTTVVRGRLFLTRRQGPWRVFGYDVSKGVRA